MYNEEFNDNESIISEEIEERNPQQVIFEEEAVKTVDINQVIEEFSSNPCEIYRFYSSERKDIPEKDLISEVESLIMEFAEENQLHENEHVDSLLNETELEIKEFENLLKFALNKDNEPILPTLCVQSELIKEYVEVICDTEFIEFKLDELQQKYDLLVEEKNLAEKTFIVSRPSHEKEFEDLMDFSVSCKARNKLQKKNEVEFVETQQNSTLQ